MAHANRGSVLVFGGTGMLGHEVVRTLAGDEREVHFTVRTRAPAAKAELPGTLHDFTAGAGDPRELIERLRPRAVVNAIGIVKQRPEGSVPLISIPVNSLLPHQLNAACSDVGAQLVHVSTDCVFSGALPLGRRYTEEDQPDARDLYGRSKLLGEVEDGAAVTLRTSIVGWELERSSGLLEWFADQEGNTVAGFTQAVFTGLTTRALARVIRSVVDEHPDLRGLYHVASEPISKFDLLRLLRDTLDQKTEIEPQAEPIVNRALNGNRFEQTAGLAVPSWEEMSAEYAGERSPRRSTADA